MTSPDATWRRFPYLRSLPRPGLFIFDERLQQPRTTATITHSSCAGHRRQPAYIYLYLLRHRRWRAIAALLRRGAAHLAAPHRLPRCQPSGAGLTRIWRLHAAWPGVGENLRTADGAGGRREKRVGGTGDIAWARRWTGDAWAAAPAASYRNSAAQTPAATYAAKQRRSLLYAAAAATRAYAHSLYCARALVLARLFIARCLAAVKCAADSRHAHAGCYACAAPPVRLRRRAAHVFVRCALFMPERPVKFREPIMICCWHHSGRTDRRTVRMGRQDSCGASLNCRRTPAAYLLAMDRVRGKHGQRDGWQAGEISSERLLFHFRTNIYRHHMLTLFYVPFALRAARDAVIRLRTRGRTCGARDIRKT